MKDRKLGCGSDQCPFSNATAGRPFADTVTGNLPSQMSQRQGDTSRSPRDSSTPHQYVEWFRPLAVGMAGEISISAKWRT
jgi:hypothetical protein